MSVPATRATVPPAGPGTAARTGLSPGRVSTGRAPARVAYEVAAAQLGRVLPGLAAPVGYEIDWAGPVRMDLADESSVQAACGLMHVHGRAEGRPLALAVDYASTVAGLLAAQGVLAALVGRARGLRVDAVRTSVAQAALLAVSQYLAAATCDDTDPVPARPGGAPPFVAADGVRFEIETLDASDWQRFWARLGADPGAVRDGWAPFQHRFATATCCLPAALHVVAGRVAFPDVLAAGRATGVGVLPVRADPRHPDDRPPWTLTPLPGPPSPAIPGPHPGTGSGPLDGLVVVESTRRVQGPLAGHVLRMLGANVVRVEPPGGDPMRGMPPVAGGCSARFTALNDGKRVAEADLKTPGGRDAVRDLVTGADVFLHNWAPGRAARFGLDAADLHRVRPGLVYAHASGWGGALGADPPPGTDYLVQAHSGIAAAIRLPGQRISPSLMTLTDVLGGLVSALGVLAGLLSGTRTGHGVRVDSDLFAAAGVLPRTATPRVTPPGTTGAAVTADGAPVPPGASCAPVVPVCTDLRALATDDRFAAALGSAAPGPTALSPGACTLVRPPWEFR